MEGCQFGTTEVLWKYYHVVAQANQHEKSLEQSRQKSLEQSRLLKSTLQPSTTPLADCSLMTADDLQYLLFVLFSELSNENVERFVLLVEDAYRTCIEREYTGFVVIDGYHFGRTVMRQLYNAMVESFQYIHSVYALVVSCTGTRSN